MNNSITSTKIVETQTVVSEQLTGQKPIYYYLLLLLLLGTEQKGRSAARARPHMENPLFGCFNHDKIDLLNILLSIVLWF